MPHHYKGLLLASLGILSGCTTDVANRYYGQTHFAPKAVDSVAVLKAAPPEPYEVLADLQCRGATPRAMQKQAAEIGADAIIVTTLGGYYDTGNQWAGQNSQRDSQHTSFSRIIGTAIKYKTQ